MHWFVYICVFSPTTESKFHETRILSYKYLLIRPSFGVFVFFFNFKQFVHSLWVSGLNQKVFLIRNSFSAAVSLHISLSSVYPPSFKTENGIYDIHTPENWQVILNMLRKQRRISKMSNKWILGLETKDNWLELERRLLVFPPQLNPTSRPIPVFLKCIHSSLLWTPSSFISFPC